jgi:hypothetical protein
MAYGVCWLYCQSSLNWFFMGFSARTVEDGFCHYSVIAEANKMKKLDLMQTNFGVIWEYESVVYVPDIRHAYANGEFPFPVLYLNIKLGTSYGISLKLLPYRFYLINMIFLNCQTCNITAVSHVRCQIPVFQMTFYFSTPPT